MTTIRRLLRIILALALAGMALHAADLATRDCRLAPYVYDDCMWIWVRRHLHLPASKFLRMAVMECVGIFLASVLYFTLRYIFPWRSRRPAPSATVLESQLPSH
jgi:hypothetical protein